MRLLFIITSFLLFSAAHADAQGRAAAAGSCDLPHISGVATQQLMSGQRPRTYRLFVPPDTTDTSASR
jgi:poly(3-hydroxybutyrate) depolymerase